MRTTAYSLSEPFSLYLDLARFLAAVLVVCAHYLQHKVASGGIAYFLPGMGREAVVIFFVLSGFVIAYTTQRRAASAGEYVAARFGRIFSVVIPTLILAIFCSLLLAGLSRAELGYQFARPYVYLPLHLLFLGQSWTLSEVPPLLGAYWSLCYEVWYYVIFGLAYYLRGWVRGASIGLALAVMGFKLWILLPVWLSGVALFHLQARYSMPKTIARTGFIATLLLLGWYNLSNAEAFLRTIGIAAWPFPDLGLGSAERYLADYVVAAIVVGNFWCARFVGLACLNRCGKKIRAAASYTFTLYLGHMLVLSLWMMFYPHDSTSLMDVLALTLAIVLVTLALGEITEHRKEKFRWPVDWLITRFSGRRDVNNPLDDPIALEQGGRKHESSNSSLGKM